MEGFFVRTGRIMYNQFNTVMPGVDENVGREAVRQVRDDGGNGLSTQNGSQFGLRALRERLTAVYGKDARLDIASDPHGFAVSFVVPRSVSEDADDE